LNLIINIGVKKMRMTSEIKDNNINRNCMTVPYDLFELLTPVPLNTEDITSKVMIDVVNCMNKFDRVECGVKFYYYDPNIGALHMAHPGEYNTSMHVTLKQFIGVVEKLREKYGKEEQFLTSERRYELMEMATTGKDHAVYKPIVYNGDFSLRSLVKFFLEFCTTDQNRYHFSGFDDETETMTFKWLVGYGKEWLLQHRPEAYGNYTITPESFKAVLEHRRSNPLVVGEEKYMNATFYSAVIDMALTGLNHPILGQSPKYIGNEEVESDSDSEF
jgi:hypothetical protein